MTDASPTHIFEVRPDLSLFDDQWFLTEPRSINGQEIDAREFTEGVPYRGQLPAIVPVANPGKEVAFHLGAFDMPVVSAAVAEKIMLMAATDVELFPVEIPGAQDSHLILNVVCALDCLDERRSELTRWREEDNRPDRLGQIHVISIIRVDPLRTRGHHIFRIKDWPLALLVSDRLKSALETIADLGIVFDPAS